MSALALLLALATVAGSPVAGAGFGPSASVPGAGQGGGAPPPRLTQLRAPAPPASRDTVLALRRGERVTISGLSGSVHIEAVPGDRLEVTARGRDTGFEVGRGDRGPTVRGAGLGAMGRPLELDVRVPAWADLEVEGLDLDATVVGLEGSVTVAVVSGDLRIVGTGGSVRAGTVSGDVFAEEATGALALVARAGDVRVRGATGPVEAESLSGDLVLEGIRAPSVRAETQAGDIAFSGSILAGGRYGFFLHSGSVRLALPADVRADVRVSTFHGEFDSDFPVEVSRYEGGRRFEFALGGGGGEVQVEVFEGEIRLVRGN